MRTSIGPVNQTSLAQTTMDDTGGMTVRRPLSFRTPALLLPPLTVAVRLLSSAHAMPTGGQPTVTTGGQPMKAAGAVSYALVSPVQTVELPHVEVYVDGSLITPST